MKNVFVLFVSGEMFLFEDCGYSPEIKRQLEIYARNALTENPTLEMLDNKAICEWYMRFVKSHLNICINKVNISFIARINK